MNVVLFLILWRLVEYSMWYYYSFLFSVYLIFYRKERSILSLYLSVHPYTRIQCMYILFLILYRLPVYTRMYKMPQVAINLWEIVLRKKTFSNSGLTERKKQFSSWNIARYSWRKKTWLTAVTYEILLN